MDQVVVITGASAGIGAALAVQVAAEGARVVLLARREREIGEVAARVGAGALPIVTDVTDRAQVDRAVVRAVEELGRIDVWVNNAGRGISRLVSEFTDADLDEMMFVNVKSALCGMQAVLPHFERRGRGHIINVSSLLGRVPFAPARSAYSAAKHALNALTASLRLELRPAYPEIAVSAVHPGVVATDFGLNALHGGPDSRTFAGAQSAEEVAAVIVDLIARPRADVYTRPGAREMVASYFAAEDLDAAEAEVVPGTKSAEDQRPASGVGPHHAWGGAGYSQ